MAVILVTGAAGFIGSHVSEALLQRGDTVIGIDNLNDYYSPAFKERNLDELGKYEKFSLYRGDLVDRPLLNRIFESHPISHIAHIAARAGVRPSIADPFVYEDTNVRGTLNLLEAAREGRVQNFVLTSSSSVYGNSKAVPFRENDSATDRPISPYAATKKATEVMGYTYHSLYGLNVNVIRPFTVYGPRGRPDMAPWIFLESAIRGKPIRRFGDGSTRRDYTYIGDFVKGFVAAIDRQLGYEIFNLGNSRTVALSEAIEIIERVTGRELKIDQHPMQPGDVEITYADLTKARSLLSYDPQTSFEQGMREFHEWYMKAFPGA